MHYCFKQGHREVAVGGGTYRVAMTELLETNPKISDALAKNIRVRFFGGPPRRLNFYDGDLTTVFADTVLWAIAIKDTESLDRYSKIKVR